MFNMFFNELNQPQKAKSNIPYFPFIISSNKLKDQNNHNDSLGYESENDNKKCIKNENNSLNISNISNVSNVSSMDGLYSPTSILSEKNINLQKGGESDSKKPVKVQPKKRLSFSPSYIRNNSNNLVPNQNIIFVGSIGLENQSQKIKEIQRENNKQVSSHSIHSSGSGNTLKKTQSFNEKSSDKDYGSFDKSISKYVPKDLLKTIRGNNSNSSIIVDKINSEENLPTTSKFEVKAKESNSVESLIEKLKIQVETKGITEYVPKHKVEIKSNFFQSPMAPSLLVNSTINQQQCLQIQNILLVNPNEYKVYLPQVISLFPTLCCDPHGNYLIQQIIPLLSKEEIIQFTNLLIIYFKDFYFHNYSTRVVQKFIELSREETQKLLLPILITYLSLLCKDHNGIHIIIKTVMFFKDSSFVYDHLIANLEEIATDKEGCCLIQKVLEKTGNKGYVS